MQNLHQQAYLAALEWHLDQGVDEMLGGEAVDKLQLPLRTAPRARTPLSQPSSAVSAPATASPLAGTQELKKQAIALSEKVHTLAELAAAIQEFDGLDVKKTATNFVFADGNPKAKIMLVGEAPGADEDRAGKPFVGVSGQLLDKILDCIGVSRGAEDPLKSIYISNVLNWRPPGNRTPTPQEMEISLPFIEKHIALIQPDILLFCGGVAAKTLLHSNDSISKLRGKTHEFMPQTLTQEKSIPAIATYHPAYLLRTPSQKAKVWQDMLFLQKIRLDNALV